MKTTRYKASCKAAGLEEADVEAETPREAARLLLSQVKPEGDAMLVEVEDLDNVDPEDESANKYTVSLHPDDWR